MTSDLPPLSEIPTPTQCPFCGELFGGYVPRAEHERIVAEHDLTLATAKISGYLECEKNTKDEVERLKKELEAVKRYGKFVELKPLLDGAYQAQRNEFIAEGERRAMQRVKEAIKRQYASCLESEDWSDEERTGYSICRAIEKELGFDGIENSSTEGTDVPSWSDKDDEVSDE